MSKKNVDERPYDVVSVKEKRRERYKRKRQYKFLDYYKNAHKGLYNPKREV